MQVYVIGPRGSRAGLSEALISTLRDLGDRLGIIGSVWQRNLETRILLLLYGRVWNMQVNIFYCLICIYYITIFLV